MSGCPTRLIAPTPPAAPRRPWHRGWTVLLLVLAVLVSVPHSAEASTARSKTRAHTVKAASTPAPTNIPGTWRVKFADEFNGKTLDTSRWSTGWFGTGVTGPVQRDEPACYDPAQIQFRGTVALSIEMIKKTQTCSGRARPWTTGLLTSNGKFEYTYGVSEARIYLPADDDSQPLNWPSFWADGQNWPDDGENDVMESSGGSTSAHFHSPAGGPGFEVPGNWGGWHTFASVWEPGSVTYYYDGKKVGVIDDGITSAPMYLILGFGPAADGVSTQAATMKVDYVRVWQH